MATITTAGSGNWNSTTPNAPWPGGTIPAATDEVIIANGHTLTVPAGYTAQCGNPATPTVHAIRTSATAGGTGVLIVNGILQVAADMRHDNANWQVVGAGAMIESTNTTTALTWQVADTNGRVNARVTVTGTGIGANRAVIRNGVGAAGFRLTTAGNIACYTTSYAKFEDLGTSALAALRFISNDSGVAQGSSFEDTVFTNCGRIDAGGHQILAPLTIRRVLLTGSKDTTTAMVWPLSITNPSASRVFEDFSSVNSVVQIQFPSAGTVFPTFTRCYFDSMSRTGTGTGEFVDCAWRRRVSGGGGTTVAANVTRGLSVMNAPAVNNWHGLVLTNSTAAVTADGVVVDGVCNGADGDLFFIARANTTTQATIRNVLSTVSADSSGAYGKMVAVSATTGSGAALAVCENNTWITTNSEAGMIRNGETTAGLSGQVGLVRNNLVWGRASGQGQAIGRDSAGAAANTKDYVAPGDVSNNAVVNPVINATNGDGHVTAAGGDGLMWTASAPSYTSASDPLMTDSTRNLATWYRSVVGGTPGTRTADMDLALAAIAEQWGDSPVAGATIPAAWTWIRDGYKPQNTALRTGVSGNNGGWLGAVEGVGGRFRDYFITG